MFVWLVLLVFYFSYLFSVILLSGLVIFLGLVYMSGYFFVKYLFMMIYVSGVVVFILYISCMCWNVSVKLNFFFFFFCVCSVMFYGVGNWGIFYDSGVNFWVFMFLGLLFNSMIMVYSLVLFMNFGSLRF